MDPELRAYLDRMAEAIARDFARIDARLDALEQRVGAVEGEIGSLRSEMRERFQSVDDRFATMDLRFIQVLAKIDHVGARQDTLEASLKPLPEIVRSLEASLSAAYRDVLKQLEPMQEQIVGVNQRLDSLSEEMRQRFRTLRYG